MFSTYANDFFFLCVDLFRVKEELFWKNYFYRVSLIKQSAQLTALAVQQATQREGEKSASRYDDTSYKGTIKCIYSVKLCPNVYVPVLSMLEIHS